MPSGFPRWLETGEGEEGSADVQEKGEQGSISTWEQSHALPRDTRLVGGWEVEEELSQGQHPQGPTRDSAGCAQAERMGRRHTENHPALRRPGSGANMNFPITPMHTAMCCSLGVEKQ